MKTLLPLQWEGAHFLAKNYHAANGDEAGTGKTLQAIHAANLAQATNVLVTCPASVRTSWREHIYENAFIPQGWDVISYNEACDPKARAKLRRHYDLFIPDEVHFLKTVDSQRTRAIFGSKKRDGFDGLARRADYKWPLSGTLAPNGRPVELFPMLKNLCPAFLDMPFGEYARLYCNAYFDGRELNVKGSSRVDELARLLKDFVIRRTLTQFFPDRLEPVVSRVGFDLSDVDLRDVHAAEDEIGGREARLSSSYEKVSQMGDTARLRRLIGVAMVGNIAQFALDKLETVDKIAVFFQHTDVGLQLRRHFELRGYASVFYQGGMGDKAKDEAVKLFQSPGIPVFLGQVQAAGTGINGLQQATSTLIVAEPGWAPGETEQWIKRLDRMGLKDPLVNAYLLYARNTLSEVVVRVHDRKEDRMTRLLDPWKHALGSFA